MKCKNCGHEIEEVMPITGLPEEVKFIHILEDYSYREVQCWCSFEKPEPKVKR